MDYRVTQWEIEQASEFVASQLSPATDDPFGESFRMWRPDNKPVVKGMAHTLPVDTIRQVADSSRLLRRNVTLSAVVNPLEQALAAAFQEPLPTVEADGPLDQPDSMILVDAGNEKAFDRLWTGVGEAMDMPKGATAEEVGLTILSRIGFVAVREALTRYHNQGIPKRPGKGGRVYKPMFPSTPGRVIK